MVFKSIRQQLDSVMARDPAARSRFEVLLTYPGVHVLFFHRIAHWLYARRRWLFARLVSQLGRWLTGIEIHPGATVGRRLFIDHGMGVVIGETAEVGDGCTIYQGVTLGGTSLYPGTKRHPTLGAGVIVAAGAKVLGGFTVGDGARIGANAVVLKEVPAGATVVGVPGRIVKGEGAERDARFAAYGVGNEFEDPHAKAIQALVAYTEELEQRLRRLEAGESPEKDKNIRIVK